MAEFFALFVSEWYILPLFLLGYALCVIEMFVPGFGLPGISGIALLILATSLTGASAVQIVWIVLILIFLLAVSFAVVGKTLRSSRNPLVNAETVTKEAPHDQTTLIGCTGTATTVLRPVGIADFNGKRVQVSSEGGFIPSGARVIAIGEAENDDHTLLVREDTDNR